MEYRVENKYLVSDQELELIRQRIQPIVPVDPHQTGDFYEIRSIYFDNLWDQCMLENDAGVDLRKKYRIRTYGPSSPSIHLEIKEKERGYTKKTACDISKYEVNQILKDSLPFTFDGRSPFNLLKLQMRCSGMTPKAVIYYERSAFVYPAGNVRITFDRNIMASRYCRDFFCENMTGLVPVLPTGMHILEVKYDEFLPDFIADQLEIHTLQQTAFSKYYLGRLALRGSFPVGC